MRWRKPARKCTRPLAPSRPASRGYGRLSARSFPALLLCLTASTQATMAAIPDRQELIRNAVVFLADPKACVLRPPKTVGMLM